MSPEAVRALIEPDRVDRRVYTDPAIFALEIERIFARAWIYVAHASQLKQPGDFVTTKVAQQDVVVIRHLDGSIRALRNRCGHRGARVVAERSGNAKRLQCPYHGWTFLTDGALDAVPLPEGYDGTGFERSLHGMQALPRVASYRGFVFASLAAEGPDLESFLGPAGAVLDNMVERAPEGELEIAGGTFRALQRNNWKIYLENLHDGVHAQSVHRASIEASRAVAATLTGPPRFALEIVAANGIPFREMGKLTVNCYGHGHSDMRGFRKTRATDPEFQEYEAALARRIGADGAAGVLDDNRHNALIYPGFSVHPAFQQLRVIIPERVDRTVVEVWCLRMKGAPAHMHRRTVAFANAVHSPASIVKVDDLEAYERVQEGWSDDGWVSLHRGAGRAGGATALDERFIRNQYQAWLGYMEAA
ncbi:MAG: Rieske 2Fe-2S domain-containing protein [Proteobacteria bacterium]|nr:Rieske 2Fe-2S domain-containing protein [Pseudomonadota bacterium]MBI3498406.1 Rieske 2Fe-2S domain-containing protein [Pseudomonadota bacterium]